MRDDDRLLDLAEPEFGSGVVGVCDICGQRQAVIVLLKERYRLCVIDFLNKTWMKSERKPTAPAPLYRSERIWFPSTTVAGGRAPAIVLTPTKPIRHPVVLVVPDVYGITTTLLDAAIRFAREGFEVLLPDVGKTAGIGLPVHASMRAGRLLRGGVPVASPRVASLLAIYRDALRALLGREMVDTNRAALFGTSYGGALAVALAAESTQLTAVAVAYPLSVAPAGAANLLTAPVFVVRGETDGPAERAERQLKESDSGSRLTTLHLPGARHGFLSRDLRAYDLPLAEQAWAGIVAFLKERLMPSPPKPPAPPTRQAAVAITPASAPVVAPATAAAAPRA